MALKSNFNAGRSMQNVQKQADNLYTRIVKSFMRSGEKFITEARGQMQSHAMGQYMDRTTHLRNSIGYFIFLNGVNVFARNEHNLINMQDIEPFVKSDGVQLIGIAGMNYASHVESKGYNVISYQADLCIVDIAFYFERLEMVEKGTAARMEESFIPE